MGRLVILNFGQGSLCDGFPNVTMQLGELDSTYQMKFSASLPPAPEISEIYRSWQLVYSGLYQCLYLRDINDDDFEIEEACITNISELDINYLCQQFSMQMNAWLNSSQFRKIDQQLRTQLKPSEEIRFIIETNELLLKKLPWHLWNFFEDYPLAEVAISALEYHQLNKLPPNIDNSKVKILAIFGNSQGINISQDRLFLEKLSTQAEIKFLVEPKLNILNDQLWQQGWDILFFAGHSSNQGKGQLYINQTDTITLEQLKYAIRQAISRGLKLAIFNSCDGLGLAQQLQDLHIPQVIIMREPVPDVVAQEFLKNFITEFSQGHSLYAAVRAARERLQGLEIEYPCATWLPIICQNPAESPMVWHPHRREMDSCHESDFLQIDSWSKPKNRVRNLGNKSPYITLQHQVCIPNRKEMQTLLIVSLLVLIFLMGLRNFGMLQASELQAYDRLMQMQPLNEKPDPRLLLVTIDEADIQYQIKKNMKMNWSLSDQALTQLLQKLEKYQPQTIGIDIYRDFSVDPKYPELANRLQQDQRLFALCKVAAPDDDAEDGTPPPPEIAKERLGFSDFIADEDRIPRRQLLHMTPPLKSTCGASLSFSYQLAKHYLNAKGIIADINSKGNLQIGDVVFPPIRSHSSGYQRVDASGYQILLRYRLLPTLQKIAAQVSLRDILDDQVKPELIDSVKNRIIIIGAIAPSTSDDWLTPFSSGASDSDKIIPGLFVQAQMISHLLSAVLDHRRILWCWASGWEILWVWVWTLAGGIIAWHCQYFLYLSLSVAIGLLVLFSICFYVFSQAGWIPLVPAALALVLCAVGFKGSREYESR
jgi:CHASE2 domain-containing sensor protein